MTRRHLVVIDPGTRVPELDCFNRLSRNSPLPASYHLPAQQGVASLHRTPDEGLAGIVMFGSGASVHDNLDWQQAMDDWLLPRIERGVPFLGLCYGHQHIAHRLGGEVGFVREDHEKIRGLRPTRLVADRLWGEAVDGAMVVSHREVVTALPSGFAVLGQRDDCPVDALGHPTRPIWGFQPHPEATMAFVENNGIAYDGVPRDLDFGNSLVDAFTRFCAQ